MSLGPARLPREDTPRPAAQNFKHRTRRDRTTTTMPVGFVVVQAGAGRPLPLLPLWSTGQQKGENRGTRMGGWHGEGGTGTAVIQSSSRPVMRVDKLSGPQRVHPLAWLAAVSTVWVWVLTGGSRRMRDLPGNQRRGGGAWRGSSSRSATPRRRRLASVEWCCAQRTRCDASKNNICYCVLRACVRACEEQVGDEACR